MYVIRVLFVTGIGIEYSRSLIEILEVVLQVHEVTVALADLHLERLFDVAFHLLVLLVPVV